MEAPWLIMGLGNPGNAYAGTYHNVGFRVVERIAGRHRTSLTERCGAARIGDAVLAGQAAVLVLPQTYMNRSGDVLPDLFERFQASASKLIVVYDDLALPIGKIRIRQKGSAGGHNGVKSIISTLGSDDFLRIRVGILPDRQVESVHDFVLSRVDAADRDLLDRCEEVAANAVETLIAEGIEKAMAAYNGLDLRVELEKDN
jgi:PTH1 family peptidyl-tRNA hydrolase